TSGPGLAASFFNLSASPANGGTGGQTAINYLASPVFTRLDPNINYPVNSGGLVGPGTAGNPAALPASVQATSVRLVWPGYLNVVAAGSYTFTDLSDDGSTLFIDGTAVVTNTGNATGTGTATLSAGLHTFRVLYYNGGGTASHVISYSGPDTGGSTVVIPGTS